MDTILARSEDGIALTLEELKQIMKRMFAILLALALPVLFCAAACAETAGGTETPEVATPTDLDPAGPVCAHERTETTLYFANPKYTSVNSKMHRVSGAATAVTECRDCGETVEIRDLDWAEEYRFHTFRKGACFLCGAPQPETESAGEAAGEAASAASPAPENGGFWAAFDETLTNVTDFGNIFLFGCAGSARCCR